jgi:hypothetical protein
MSTSTVVRAMKPAALANDNLATGGVGFDVPYPIFLRMQRIKQPKAEPSCSTVLVWCAAIGLLAEPPSVTASDARSSSSERGPFRVRASDEMMHDKLGDEKGRVSGQSYRGTEYHSALLEDATAQPSGE